MTAATAERTCAHGWCTAAHDHPADADQHFGAREDHQVINSELAITVYTDDATAPQVQLGEYEITPEQARAIARNLERLAALAESLPR